MSPKTTLAALALLLLPLTTAQAGKKKKKELEQAAALQALAEQAKIKPTILVEVDFDEDGVIDVRNYYLERGGNRVLLRKETDLNFDGRVDVVSEFGEDGVMERELMDGDFDGQFDWSDFYEGGERVRSEIDTDFNGLPDVTNHYSNGVVTKKERDVDADGDVDFWETFDSSGNRTSASTDTTEEEITTSSGAAQQAEEDGAQ